MIRKASLLLALAASLAIFSGSSARQAKADDFLRNAAGAALIMNGIGSMIQATQPHVNVYPGGYPGGVVYPGGGFAGGIVYPGGFAPPPAYPGTIYYYPPAPAPAPYYAPGGMPGVLPVNYPGVMPQFHTTILP